MNDDAAQQQQFEYVGFWPRVGASLIDTVLALMLAMPLLSLFGASGGWVVGWDVSLDDMDFSHSGGLRGFLISYVLPAVAVIVFWITKQATPGKMAIGAKIVDARTGGPLTPGQSIGRYLAYYVSIFPFCLGLLWVAFDSRKQGWHDKLAGTVVIRATKRGTEPVRFDGR